MHSPWGVLWKVKSSGFGHKSVYHEAVKPAQFLSRDFSQELYKPYTFPCLSNVKLLFLKKGTGRSWCDSLENNSQVTVYFRLFPPKKEKLIKCIGKVSRLKSLKGNQITELCKQICGENWGMLWTKRSGLLTALWKVLAPLITPAGRNEGWVEVSKKEVERESREEHSSRGNSICKGPGLEGDEACRVGIAGWAHWCRLCVWLKSRWPASLSMFRFTQINTALQSHPPLPASI